MALVTSSYAHVHNRATNKEILIEAADFALDQAIIAAHEFLPFLEVRAIASAEEGSLKTRTKLYATAVGLYFGIGNLGSFAGGVREIVSASRSAMAFVNNQVIERLANDGHVIRARRDTGFPGKLARLFERVESGEMTAEEAMREVDDLLRNLEEPIPTPLTTSIKDEIRHLASGQKRVGPQSGLQQQLLVAATPSAPKPPKRTPRHRLRVDVWMDASGRRRRSV